MCRLILISILLFECVGAMWFLVWEGCQQWGEPTPMVLPAIFVTFFAIGWSYALIGDYKKGLF